MGERSQSAPNRSGAADAAGEIETGRGCALERWAEIEGCRLRYLRCGQGPPLMAIHGLLGYAFSWRRNLAQLGEQFTVYAPDLPGCGYSEALGRNPSSLSQTARFLLKFMDAEGLGRADMLGSSRGGAVAMMMAAVGAEEGKQRVRKLALAAPVNPWSLQGRTRARILSSPPCRRLLQALRPWFPAMHRREVGRMYGNPRLVTQRTREGYADPLRLPGRLQQALNVAAGWGRDLRELERALPLIRRIPTLLIWGDRDRAVYAASAQPLKANFDHARLMLLAGVGHLPFEEAPQEFNRAVIEFLLSGSC